LLNSERQSEIEHFSRHAALWGGSRLETFDQSDIAGGRTRERTTELPRDSGGHLTLALDEIERDGHFARHVRRHIGMWGGKR